MYQAIRTKYIGPRNVRGSRVKAIAIAGSITLDWDDGLSSDENHIAAARALATKAEWAGEWHGGMLINSERVFVHGKRDSRDGFTVTQKG